MAQSVQPELNRLRNMGFCLNDELATDALIETNGDINAVIEMLTAQTEAQQEEAQTEVQQEAQTQVQEQEGLY